MGSEQHPPVFSMFDGMRRFVSGVTILTANNRLGERFAMTATSVTSVSGEPQSMLACVNQQARLNQAMKETEFFCINLLSPKHKQLSVNCATPDSGVDRFEHGNWHCHEKTGVFYLADAQAVFFCEKKLVQRHGTHDIFIGDVLETHVANESISILAYMNCDYLTLDQE